MTASAALVVILAAVGIAVSAGAGLTGDRGQRILFGLGPEAEGARKSILVRAAPVRMLTSWFNGPSDLSWMSGWRRTEVPRDYAAGYAMHLVVWLSGPKANLSTRYGLACGEAYPLSKAFLGDMARLARIFRGSAKDRFYVTLFSEFQTYACNGNAWAEDPRTTAYLKALKDQYLAAMAIFHRGAPNSAVALGWGGWQARWDDPARGGGRSLFGHFADVMRRSDFESFEVINSTTDTSDVLGMTRELGRFGPVMLAYYRPEETSIEAARAHLDAVLAPAFLRRLAAAHLFALGLMDDRLVSEDPASLTIASTAIRRADRSIRTSGVPPAQAG